MEIEIQGKTVTVVPQKHARLRNKLSTDDFDAIFQGFASGTYAVESYRVLSVLVPDLKNHFKEYEWDGYVSQEAKDNDQYDEEADPGPTTAEIVLAFETALMVSGAERLGKIIDLVQSSAAIQGN